jgi:two-component system, NarL family, nitrate/nitrite response regulator NarL
MASSVQLRLTETKGRSIDLLIADETPMNCQLLKGVLRLRSAFRVVACAVSKEEILAAINSHNVDIALINETLQDGALTGFSALNDVHNMFPKTRVIVLLKSTREDLVIDAFRAGARGIFCRAEPPHVICKCISAVHEGQIWANSSQLSAVLGAFVGASPLRIKNSQGGLLLTKREKDVIKLVVEGYTNREAGKKLGLTEHTVSNYLFRTYEKLGISSRVELVLYSIKSQSMGP